MHKIKSVPWKEKARDWARLKRLGRETKMCQRDLAHAPPAPEGTRKVPGASSICPPPPHFLSEPRRRGGRGPAIELATHRHKCIQKFGPTLPPRGAQNCVTQKEKNNSEALKGGEGNMEGGEGL